MCQLKVISDGNVKKDGAETRTETDTYQTDLFASLFHLTRGISHGNGYSSSRIHELG